MEAATLLLEMARALTTVVCGLISHTRPHLGTSRLLWDSARLDALLAKILAFAANTPNFTDPLYSSIDLICAPINYRLLLWARLVLSKP
jgi:hypothetical protein